MCDLIFLDVDGCLTDGKIIYGHNIEIKEFNVKDGAAIIAWQKLGKHIAIITGRKSQAVIDRANDLGIKEVYTGVNDKLSVASSICKKLELELENCAAIGDYYNDMALLKRVGYAFKPNDGLSELEAIQLRLKGGEGCVDEMIRYLVNKNGMQKQWNELWNQ